MRLVGRTLFALYQPIFLLNVIVNTTVLGFIVIALTFFDRRGRLVHYIGKFWSRLNLLATGVRTRVEGLEHLQPGQPYVLMANHQSYYDVWALIGFLPLQLRWVMKAELRKVPIFGLGCERMGHIYVQRGHSGRARASLMEAGEKIRTGISVVFFPEGTRSRDGRLGPFKRGGFIVAQAAKVPIVPVTVNGGRHIFARDSIALHPGRMTVHVHPPIPLDESTQTDQEALIQKVRAAIDAGLE